MKLLSNYWISLFISSIFASCGGYPSYEIPDKVSFEENIVYINGKLRPYVNSSILLKINDKKEKLIVAFEEIVNNGQIINRFSGSTFDLEENKTFELTTDDKTCGNCMEFHFSQVIENDLIGWEYKLINDKSNYFKIDQFDTVNQILSGKGQLTFRRIHKNGLNGDNLDKFLNIQFVFNDRYLLK